MEWLNQILTSLGKIFPVIWIVDPDECGVRITPKLFKGIFIKDLSPGWWFLWRVIQTGEKIKIVPQVIDLRGQSITTKDGKSILISGAVQYRVSNARKAILNIYDYDSNLQKITLGVLARYAATHTYEECRDSIILEKEVLNGIREVASGWGLRIMRIFITDLCQAQCIRVVGNNNIIPLEGE